MTLKFPLIFASTAMLALTACTEPMIRDDDPNKLTKSGALIGSLSGAAVGVLSGDDAEARRRGAVIGGVLGAGVGAAIGYNLDQQAAELQRDFGDGRIQIINNGDHLIVRMPEGILFDVDSASVKPALRSHLQVLAASLEKYPGSTIQVVGHTDNTGTASYNQDLSERRASSVSSVLIGAGVSAGRISTFGLGEDQPIATNLTEAGKAQNRRVDITIRPNS